MGISKVKSYVIDSRWNQGIAQKLDFAPLM